MADINVSCLGGPVKFSDLSSNYPNAWYWDFGDGNTDTIQNPIHVYTDTGTYTVMMVVFNNNGSDTIIYPDLIHIQNGATIASCNSEVVDINNDLGIYHVGLSSINNTTGNLQESYSDYSCVAFTILLAGSKNTLSVETGPQWEEDVRAWIDYNNDGVFDDLTELVLSSDSVLQYHSGEFFIPQGIVLDTMLRMRIISDYSGLGSMGPCDTLFYGQSEDYGIIIQASNLPPVAAFNYTITDPCEGTVEFADDSEYFPDTWSWDFGDGNSGSGSSSTHTFGAGSFDVMLIASNSFGADTVSTLIVIDSINAAFMNPGDTLQLGTSYLFLNESYGSDTWTWDFGDGNASSVEFPTHTYTVPGNNIVWLYCVNSITGCSDSVSQAVFVEDLPIIGIEQNSINDHIAVYPSPSNGEIYFQYSFQGVKPITLSIRNIAGQLVYEDKLVLKNTGNRKINLSELPKGVYLLTAILRASLEEDEVLEKSCKFIIE
jgi:PKD repeat protein